MAKKQLPSFTNEADVPRKGIGYQTLLKMLITEGPDNEIRRAAVR